MYMNLETNIGVSKFEHIYVFGCSHSLNTNSVDTACKSYSEIIADKLEIPYTNVYNYSINGSSNFENLYYLNCINSELSFYHTSDDTRQLLFGDGNIFPRKIYKNSLIIFQLTYWNRNVFQDTIERNRFDYNLVPLSPHRTYDDGDITKFNEIYYKKLSNTKFLQRNSLLPIYHTLKNIEVERENVSTLLLSWETLMSDNIQNYIIPELSDISKISKHNKWTCHSELSNGDYHLSPDGNKQLAEYLFKFINI